MIKSVVYVYFKKVNLFMDLI